MASDLPKVGIGARLLAIEKALRVLIEHASSTDPAIRERITGEVEAYLAAILAEIETPGEVDREFADKARSAVAFITRPPT